MFFMLGLWLVLLGATEVRALSPYWWFITVGTLLLAFASAIFESKINRIRDHLRMIHDHQHKEDDDAQAPHP